jgi:hypothetical protein
LFTFYVSEIIRSLLESKLDQKIREVDIWNVFLKEKGVSEDT